MKQMCWHSSREASGGSSRMRKKSSEDLALEVLIHFTATVRGFYTSLTKSIHTPLRRREEALSMTPAIRSTALHLGLVMKMNCEGVGVTHWDGASSDVAQACPIAPKGLRETMKLAPNIESVSV